MGEETGEITRGQPGDDPWRDEEAEKIEAREAYRRRLLTAIRGQLWLNGGLRISITSITLGCGLLAWVVAVELHQYGGYGWILMPGAGIMSVWPVYMVALWLRARMDSRLLDANANWAELRERDYEAQREENEAEEKVSGGMDRIWSPFTSQRYNACANDGGILIALGLLTMGGWMVWDLFTMTPGIIAELILDGIMAPAQPQLREMMPCYPWYKNLMLSTVLQFLVLAVLATIITFWWEYKHGFHG